MRNSMKVRKGMAPAYKEDSGSRPMNVDMPKIRDLDYTELGFIANGEHAIHRENKGKRKGISPTHKRPVGDAY